MTRSGSRRRRPHTVGGAVYLVLVAMTLAGVAITVAGAWRAGVSWLGAALLAGALCRLTLPEQHAGMLGVRGKFLDVGILTLAGLALVVLAVVIPDQPG